MLPFRPSLRESRAGQATASAVVLVVLLALVATFALRQGDDPDPLPGVTVEFIEPPAEFRGAGGGSAPPARVPAWAAASTGDAARGPAVSVVLRSPEGPSTADGGLDAGGLAPAAEVVSTAGGPDQPRLSGLARFLSAPEVEAVELGHAEGDFIYRRGTGWCRYEPASDARAGRFVPVPASQVPFALRSRYPDASYPASGLRVAESSSTSEAPLPARTAPWELDVPAR